MKVVWLASYPRSGNTFLRTILWQCFGLRSASIYPDDLGSNRKLEEYVGHLEHDQDRRIRFPQHTIPLIKTHEHPSDMYPAIYVIRDGRAASISLWKFYNGMLPLDAIIEGQHRFGTWSDHVRAWDPCNRPNTLLIEYEDMKNNMPATLDKLGVFLKRDALKKQIPARDTIAGIDGQWVKRESDWRNEFSDSLLEKFTVINGDILKMMGYI